MIERIIERLGAVAFRASQDTTCRRRGLSETRSLGDTAYSTKGCQRENTRVPDGHLRVSPTGLAPISHPAPPQIASRTPSSPATSRTKKMFGLDLVCSAPRSPLG